MSKTKKTASKSNSKKTTSKVVKTTKSTKRVKNTSPSVEKLVEMGKPTNTGRVNRTTGYKGVHKRVYDSGKVSFRTRLMFEGIEYGTHHSTAKAAAEEYNKLAIKFYGKKRAERLNLLNII